MVHKEVVREAPLFPKTALYCNVLNQDSVQSICLGLFAAAVIYSIFLQQISVKFCIINKSDVSRCVFSNI